MVSQFATSPDDERAFQRRRIVLSEELAVEIYKHKLVPSDKNGKMLKGRSATVAKFYNVSPKAIRDIWNHKTWKYATFHIWSGTFGPATTKFGFSSCSQVDGMQAQSMTSSRSLEGTLHHRPGRPKGSCDTRPRKRMCSMHTPFLEAKDQGAMYPIHQTGTFQPFAVPFGLSALAANPLAHMSEAGCRSQCCATFWPAQTAMPQHGPKYFQACGVAPCRRAAAPTSAGQKDVDGLAGGEWACAEPAPAAPAAPEAAAADPSPLQSEPAVGEVAPSSPPPSSCSPPPSPASASSASSSGELAEGWGGGWWGGAADPLLLCGGMFPSEIGWLISDGGGGAEADPLRLCDERQGEWELW
jgi:hypothetical protein